MIEQCDVHIVVEEDGVVLVLPRHMDHFPTPWEHAWQLGAILEQASRDVPNKPLVIDGAAVSAETAQIKLAKWKDKYVILVFKWTDRLKFSAEAAKLVGRAIRAYAQDLDLWKNKRVRMTYDGWHHVPLCFPGPKTVFGPK